MKKLLTLLGLIPTLLFSQTPTMRQVASAGTAITRLPAASTTTVSPTDTIMVFRGGVWIKTKVSAISSGGGSVTTATAPLVITGNNISLTANSFWETDGNAGTVDGTHFIGTTDNIPFNIRVNNQESGRIDNTNFIATYGYRAGTSLTSGGAGVFIGDLAGEDNTTGNNNVFIGQNSGKNNISSAGNTFVGTGTGPVSTSGNNTFLGYATGTINSTGTSNTYVGYNANGSATLTNATAIGANANVSASNSLILGNGANVGIGTSTPNQQLEITNSFRLPATSSATVGVIYSGANTYIHNFGTNNFFAGVGAGNLTTSGVGFNTGVGYNALNVLSTGQQNTAIGSRTLLLNTKGYINTALGESAMEANTNASYNTALGAFALSFQDYANGGTAWATFNVAIGDQALLNTNPTSTVTGYHNTALGSQAGVANTIGNSNTFLGYTANNLAAPTINNSTAVGAFATVTASNSMVLGSINGVNGATANTNVGIGTTAPAVSFQISQSGGLIEMVRLTNTNTDGANDEGETISFQATSTASVTSTYAQISGETAINSTTAGTRRGRLTFNVRNGLNLQNDYIIDENLLTHTWGLNGTQNMVLNQTGLRIGSTTAPPDRLSISAGSATVAPIQLTSGAITTGGNIRVGQLQFLTDDLYFTITTGTAVQKIGRVLTGSATLNFANLAAIGCEDLTITVTGAADGDDVVVSPPNGSVVANSAYSAWVSSANTVSVRFCTFISGDPASGTFKVTVIKN